VQDAKLLIRKSWRYVVFATRNLAKCRHECALGAC
jgi:hypothetical protein